MNEKLSQVTRQNYFPSIAFPLIFFMKAFTEQRHIFAHTFRKINNSPREVQRVLNLLREERPETR